MPKTNPGQARVSAKLGFLGKPTFLRKYGKTISRNMFDSMDSFMSKYKERAQEEISKSQFFDLLLNYKEEEK